MCSGRQIKEIKQLWLGARCSSMLGAFLRMLCMISMMRARTDARTLGITPDLGVVRRELPRSSSSTYSAGPRLSSAPFEQTKGVQPAPRGYPITGTASKGNEGRYEWVSLKDADDSLCSEELASREWALFRFAEPSPGVWRPGKINLSRMVVRYAPDGVTKEFSVRLRWSQPLQVLCNRAHPFIQRNSRSLTQGSPPLGEAAQASNTTSPSGTGSSSAVEDEPLEAPPSRNSRQKRYILVVVIIIGSLTMLLLVLITVVLRLREKQSTLVSGKARARDIQCTF